MSFGSPLENRRWGNRLAVNRSLDLWRQYGAETALFELQKEWSRFLFWRDARHLALTPKTILALANETFDHTLSLGLPLWGEKMWEEYRDHRAISSREKNVWITAFVDAYTEQIEANMAEVIPKELEGKLPIFCSLVSTIAAHLESGYDPDDFGITLGRKAPEIEKYHPRKTQIIKEAKRAGIAEAKLHWTWQTGENLHSIRYMGMVHAPHEWLLSHDETDLFENTFKDSYFSFIRHEIEKVVPKKAWKNAFLICSLYDEMEEQNSRRKSAQHQGGWGSLRSHRQHELFMEERRKEKYEKFQAEQRERYAAQAKVRRDAYAKSPTMGVMDLRAQFSSPNVSITSGAKAAFEESGEQPSKYLDRHFAGDFGEVTENDAVMNRENMATNSMVMSIYRLSTGVRFYIITDDGHMMTTLLLPHEY